MTEEEKNQGGRRGRPPKRQNNMLQTKGEARFEQVINGERLVFVLREGQLKLENRIPLAISKIRYFRLRPMSANKKKYQSVWRYAFNQGTGQKVLRFWQRNFEGEVRDGEKENLVTVTCKKTAMILSTMTDIFEEVFLESDALPLEVQGGQE